MLLRLTATSCTVEATFAGQRLEAIAVESSLAWGTLMWVL